jgi:hypothetical protein
VVRSNFQLKPYQTTKVLGSIPASSAGYRIGYMDYDVFLENDGGARGSKVYGVKKKLKHFIKHVFQKS